MNKGVFCAIMRVDADLEFIIAGSRKGKKIFFSKQDSKIWTCITLSDME